MYEQANQLASYIGPEALRGFIGQPKVPDLVERLTAQKEMLEQQLSEINEALDVLKANPELERVFRLVSKVSFRL